MTFKLGDTISLKPQTGDGQSGQCLAEPGPRSDNPLIRKVIMGEPRMCWHGPCRVTRVLQDSVIEGFIIANRYGYIRRADAKEIMRRY